MRKCIVIFILTLLFLSCQKEERENVISIALAQEPPTLDAMINSSISTRIVAVGNIYEKLINEDFSPSLATSYSIEERGLKLSFKIREDVFFHDGSEMRAEDVVASLNRWLDSYEAASVIASGARFEKVDENTVEIRGGNSMALLFIMLSSSSQSAVIMREEDAAAALSFSYIGTGPYYLEEWRSSDVIKLRSFDKYWGEKEEFDLFYYIVPDSVTRLLGLESALYDVIDTVDNNHIERLEKNENTVVLTGGFSGSVALVFNKREGVSANADFRKAVSLLIDRENIMAACYGDRGFVVDSRYMEDEFWKVQDNDPYGEKDEEKGRSLLSPNFYNQEVKILAPALSSLDKAALELYYELARLGLNVKLEVLDWASFIERRKDSSAWDIFISAYTKSALPIQKAYLLSSSPGWFADDYILSPLYSAESLEDAVILWGDIQKELWEIVPAVVLGHYWTSYGSLKNIRGIEIRDGIYFKGAAKE